MLITKNVASYVLEIHKTNQIVHPYKMIDDKTGEEIPNIEVFKEYKCKGCGYLFIGSKLPIRHHCKKKTMSYRIVSILKALEVL